MKVIFEKECIQSGLTGIILLSHGPMASATLESAKLIMGEQANLAAFGLEVSDTLEDYAAAVLECYRAFEGNAVIMVDLYGGTPFNQLILTGLKNKLNLLAISGFNLPVVMEACALRVTSTGAELLTQLEKIAKMGVINITEKLPCQ